MHESCHLGHAPLWGLQMKSMFLMLCICRFILFNFSVKVSCHALINGSRVRHTMDIWAVWRCLGQGVRFFKLISNGHILRNLGSEPCHLGCISDMISNPILSASEQALGVARYIPYCMWVQDLVADPIFSAGFWSRFSTVFLANVAAEFAADSSTDSGLFSWILLRNYVWFSLRIFPNPENKGPTRASPRIPQTIPTQVTSSPCLCSRCFERAGLAQHSQPPPPSRFLGWLGSLLPYNAKGYAGLLIFISVVLRSKQTRSCCHGNAALTGVLGLPRFKSRRGENC